MFNLDLEKAEEPEIKFPTSIGSQKKQENLRKTSTSALLTMLKTLSGSQQIAENSQRDDNTRPPYLPPEKTVCRKRSNKLKLNMEQRTDSKLGKAYVKAVYCHLASLTYMQSTSCKMPG